MYKGFINVLDFFFILRWEILMPPQAGLSQPDSQAEEKNVREERKVLLRGKVERERKRKEYTV